MTATIASPATTGATHRATAAVASAITIVTATDSNCWNAMPHREAPVVTTSMMSLRRRCSTNDQRAARIASNASWRIRSTMTCCSAVALIAALRVTSAVMAVKATNTARSAGRGQFPSATAPNPGMVTAPSACAKELTMGTRSSSETPPTTPVISIRTN